MTAAEIVGYIGAAAWLPQIITWVHRSIVKPKLRLIPNDFAEVGFTSLGLIFNIRIAFFTDNKDLIIDGLDLMVRHTDGEERLFRWAGIAETFSEITDSSGNKQIVSKDQTPIAIKILTDSFLDKFVRFQEPKFRKQDDSNTRELVSHFNYLKQTKPDSFVADVLGSKEYFSVIKQRHDWFLWKPGRYEVTVIPSSPEKFNFIGQNFAFELQEIDITLLKRNIQSIDMELQNIIKTNLADSVRESVVWQWANVTIIK
jgi:hypothetical protein